MRRSAWRGLLSPPSRAPGPRLLGCFLTACLLTLALASARADVVYFYDPLNRLVGVQSETGEVATYEYDSVGNLLKIERFAAGTVLIIDFLPRSGPPGTHVTLLGTGFSPTASEVAFNGVPASLVSATPTQIIATVPPAATTGPIGLVTPGGSATSREAFVVTTPPGPPTISAFSPAIGARGTTVELTGSNFEVVSTRNEVRFNGTRALVSSATETTLAAIVPAGATSGRITATTALGTATSPEPFFIAPAPYTPAKVDAAERIGFGETRTVTVTAADRIALLAFEGATGQRASLKVTSSSFSATVSINQPDGTRLAFTGTGGGAGFIDTRVLPATGGYTILAERAGTHTISLFEVPPDVSGPISPGGPSVPITITTPGQKARLTFDGTAGQRVSLCRRWTDPGWR